MRSTLVVLVVATALASVTCSRALATTATPSRTPVPTLTATPSFPQCDFTPAPAAGPPGTLVALSGVCYPIHSGRFGFVFFDDRLMGQVIGDTPGAYAIGFHIPLTAQPGTHDISLRYTPAGLGIIRQAPFTVTPGSPCFADCDHDGTVTVDELLIGVNITLATAALQECPTFDVSGDGTVTIDEVVQAVRGALDGCPSSGQSCRTHTECAPFLCGAPGDFRGCGICHNVPTDCVADADCDRLGPAGICGPVPPDACACTAAVTCQVGCMEDADCEIDQVCDATSRCSARRCGDDTDCSPQFSCQPVTSETAACVRRPCENDGQCLGGVCVNDRCYTTLGVCSPPVP